jgi:hypothetical protein
VKVVNAGKFSLLMKITVPKLKIILAIKANKFLITIFS